MAGTARPSGGPPLARQVEEAILLSRARSIFGRTHFFPPFAESLWRSVRGLERSGFHLSTREEERDDGKAFEARVTAPTGRVLDLGAVVLQHDGGVRVERGLIDIEAFRRFVESATVSEPAAQAA